MVDMTCYARDLDTLFFVRASFDRTLPPPVTKGTHEFPMQSFLAATCSFPEFFLQH